MSERRFIAVLAAVAICGAIIQWLTVESLRDQGYFAKYLFFADAVLAGTADSSRLADLSPGYLGFIIVCRLFGFGYSAIRAIQLFLLAAAAFAVARVALALAGRAAASAALMLVFLNRAALVNATELEPETLILFLNALAAAFFALRGPRGHAVAGLLFGISAVTRPVALGTIALIVLWLFVKRTHRLAMLFAGAAALPVVAVLALNFALTRSVAIMDPGTVFYEGMNPIASGYAGVQPQIVNDLERVIRQPDALHIAYRTIASRAFGRDAAREESNLYWQRKAVSFAVEHPARAGSLLAKKALFALHDYDAWDLQTMHRKNGELLRFPFIGFGLLLPLAVIGAVVSRREPEIIPFAAIAIAHLATLVAFYVTARQRNALLPSVVLFAVLGGVALWRSAREGRRSGVVAMIAAIAPLAAVLMADHHWQREDEHNWRSTESARRLRAIERERTPRLEALAATFDGSVTHAHAELIAEAARERLRMAQSEAEVFDVAVALVEGGRAHEAASLLEKLDGYVPVRETRAVSSVAYYLARLAVSQGDLRRAQRFVAVAMNEAEGDADVLALSAAVARALREDHRRYDDELSRLHDPFTAALARYRAARICGDTVTANEARQFLSTRMPEWRRASSAR